jgi:hypothetical protein
MTLVTVETKKAPPRLPEECFDFAIKRLRGLKKEGVLTNYDPRPSVRGGVYHFYAYAKDPELAIASTIPLSIYLTTRFGVPIFIVALKDRAPNGR